MSCNTLWDDPETNLDGVTATGAGEWVNCADADIVRFLITAASVTTGGTVLIQGNTRPDGTGTTVTVNTTAVTADGTTRVEVDRTDVFPAMRTNVSARTDGAYTTVIQGRRP